MASGALGLVKYLALAVAINIGAGFATKYLTGSVDTAAMVAFIGLPLWMIWAIIARNNDLLEKFTKDLRTTFHI